MKLCVCSPRRNFLALFIFMLCQTILRETEVLNDISHRSYKRQQIHGAGDGNRGMSMEGVQNLGGCCFPIAKWLVANKGIWWCACVCRDRFSFFLTHSSIISNGKGTSHRERIMSALIICISRLLLVTITLHFHRQKMNWPHLNPNKSLSILRMLQDLTYFLGFGRVRF